MITFQSCKNPIQNSKWFRSVRNLQTFNLKELLSGSCRIVFRHLAGTWNNMPAPKQPLAFFKRWGVWGLSAHQHAHHPLHHYNSLHCQYGSSDTTATSMNPLKVLICFCLSSNYSGFQAKVVLRVPVHSSIAGCFRGPDFSFFFSLRKRPMWRPRSGWQHMCCCHVCFVLPFLPPILHTIGCQWIGQWMTPLLSHKLYKWTR